MISPGTYKAKAVSANLGFTLKGHEQVMVEFQLSNQLDKITWYGYFSGQTDETSAKILERTISALRKCGWKGIDLNDLSGVLDNEVNLVIEHSEWNGKVSPRVQWINAIGERSSSSLKKMPMDGLIDFAEKMMGSILMIDKKLETLKLNKAQKQIDNNIDTIPAPDISLTIPGDDDIPF